MTQPPFFSIIIPTYNRAGFIAETLRSVLAQTFGAFEILVVDDGSTDNTGEVVGQFSDPRLQYFRKPNAERGAARNYGIDRAKGEYLIFLDSDDRFHPQHLQTLHAALAKQNFRPNFIATKYDFDRDGQRRPSDVAPLKEGSYGLDLFVQGNVLACNICCRRENPKLYRFEEDRRYAAVEDWLFLLQNTQQDAVYIVDALTLTMNDHDDRSMRSDNTNLIRRLELSAGWMQEHLTLTPQQWLTLQGRVFYLCAIHAYADGHRAPAVKFALRAWKGLPKVQAATLLLRTLAGRGLIDRLKPAR